MELIRLNSSYICAHKSMSIFEFSDPMPNLVCQFHIVDGYPARPSSKSTKEAGLSSRSIGGAGSFRRTRGAGSCKGITEAGSSCSVVTQFLDNPFASHGTAHAMTDLGSAPMPKMAGIEEQKAYYNGFIVATTATRKALSKAIALRISRNNKKFGDEKIFDGKNIIGIQTQRI